ncbi:hypothetical protein [Streptomyces sp. NPDC049915]|uniref:hypothetical protein n=1 Tax=Streptomyces sp. NPDC049915 TaxID=3155510 RepID=UPI0034421C67
MGANDGGVERDGPVDVAFVISLASRAVKTFSQVPSVAHFCSRLWALRLLALFAAVFFETGGTGRGRPHR